MEYLQAIVNNQSVDTSTTGTFTAHACQYLHAHALGVSWKVASYLLHFWHAVSNLVPRRRRVKCLAVFCDYGDYFPCTGLSWPCCVVSY